MIAVERFTGGRRWLLGTAAAGVVGLALTGVGAIIDTRTALASYLVAFAYWVGIAVAALILLVSFHASNARWMVVLKRPLEVMALPSGAGLILFVPIALGLSQLFPWTRPEAIHSPEELGHLEHKHLYLSVTAFLIRAVVYFFIWWLASELLFRWSRRQDVDGDPALTLKQRRFGSGMIPPIALAMTFAAFDWLMSLSPSWFSTIFGVYYFAGSFVAAIAVWTLVTVGARGPNLFGEFVTGQHLHNLGKLLLAFVAFWAYIAFSQYLLIWIANLPEEIVWYIPRTEGSWKPVFWMLIVGHFFAPFFVLLSRSLKLRRGFLVGMSCWILLIHFIDLIWIVMPSLELGVHWTHFTAFVGVGGLLAAYAFWRARGEYTVPIKDPYLMDSLRYTQP